MRRGSVLPHAAALLGSAVLCGLYAAGDAVGPGVWALGFVALLPWLWALNRTATLGGALLSGACMAVAFTAAVFPWFGGAIGRLAEIGTPAGLALLLLAAPLFQPQLLAFALVRQLARRHAGPAVAGACAAAAWVAAEWWLPKLLGDTLGHGLYPSALLRQSAELGGAAGLTLLVLLVNESLLLALQRWREGGARALRPLAVAALVPALLAGYGLLVAPAPAAPGTPTLRMGLVQSNIVDYERLRRERGTGAVVREVLDTHYAMSYDAVERQRAQALLWSETVYPTTFARPKSEAGAELDREIAEIVNAARVPLVFGTYERDDAGEYNAAAFLAPGRGLVGFYRKTRLFPLTEWVPPWLDGPAWRSLVPWSGTWRRGDGARVFPLLLADGREVPVLPLICLDAVDTRLAVDGARLGAQLILSMSNDSWFTDHPQGAQLHLAVAAFRSIETRLPQFRVTSNGISAVIDASGQVLTRSRMGERTLVVGELPLREPRRTLVVAWGDWVGAAASVALVLLAFGPWAWRLLQRQPAPAAPATPGWPRRVSLVTPGWRLAIALLRGLSRGSLLLMAGLALQGDGLAGGNTLAQLRWFGLLFVLPELLALLLMRALAAEAAVTDGALVLVRGAWRITLPRADIAAVQGWRWPWPAAGAWLLLKDGRRWPNGVAGVSPVALQQALEAAGADARLEMSTLSQRYAEARERRPPARWLQALGHPLLRFAVLPLLLAMPAFVLHQRIAYGSSLGELQSFGAVAFAKGFLLWWAAWVIAVVLVAAVLRALIELVTLLLVRWRPDGALVLRPALESAGILLLYLGPPLWLASRVFGS